VLTHRPKSRHDTHARRTGEGEGKDRGEIGGREGRQEGGDGRREADTRKHAHTCTDAGVQAQSKSVDGEL